LSARPSDLNDWRHMVSLLKAPASAVNIALVGKYVELEDAYYSVREALCHAGLYNSCCVNIEWIQSEDLEKNGVEHYLRDVQGILVPGGFGVRGIEGMIMAAEYAREKRIPYLGLCLGMQVMVIEYGRQVLRDAKVNSSEFDPQAAHPVIDLAPEQKDLPDEKRVLRRGNYPCKILPDTLAARTYGKSMVVERHRHKYEFNNDYRELLQKEGLVLSGLSPDEKLVEICELKDHPWMLGTQFHPEFLSRPQRPHPLFCGFVAAAKNILREGAQPTLPLNQ
ncbi:MAG: CTP synthase, partial [Dehalococcoidales bacterium]|nr:CTP synthase [Dehalococcoidales bacterium]